MLEALFVAAVVYYCRCFNSGARPKLFEELKPKFSVEQLKTHQFICALRNKFVAHSVNGFEDNRVTVSIPEEPPPGFKPEHLGFNQSRLVFWGFGSELCELARWADGEVEKIMEIEKSSVLHDLQGIPLDELVAIGVITPQLARMKDVKKPRK